MAVASDHFILDSAISKLWSSGVAIARPAIDTRLVENASGLIVTHRDRMCCIVSRANAVPA